MLTGSTILVADDEPYIRELFRDLLEPSGVEVRLAGSGAEALAAIEAQEPDIAILDVRMPEPTGLEILQKVREQGRDLPIIIVTAQDSSTVTIESMQHGAYEYIAKPFEPDAVLQVVEQALEYRRRTRQAKATEQQEHTQDPRDLLIGKSAVMHEVYKMIGRVASSDVTVMITGDSGTGKERVAQVLHQTSTRRNGPFVAVNCAALPETLLESELFGHEKGSFTGAMAQRKGRFEQAAKGSIFLDEIGEMTPATQKKLLRVLQERTFERVGGNVTVKANVRVIAATNKDLGREVSEGNFREDLYYRLNVINIHLPPLHERKDDIPILVEYFLARHAKTTRSTPPRLSEEAMQWLIGFDWPGNVRQLENTIERAVVLAQGNLIEPDHLLLPNDDTERSYQPNVLTTALTTMLKQGQGLDTILHQVRSQLITLALQHENGDRVAAARLLAVPEEHLD